MQKHTSSLFQWQHVQPSVTVLKHWWFMECDRSSKAYSELTAFVSRGYRKPLCTSSITDTFAMPVSNRKVPSPPDHAQVDSHQCALCLIAEQSHSLRFASPMMHDSINAFKATCPAAAHKLGFALIDCVLCSACTCVSVLSQSDAQLFPRLLLCQHGVCALHLHE